jgi:RimJ/RimL family protein N-acetyltransferase
MGIETIKNEQSVNPVIFIAGELVDLCAISSDCETLRSWSSWFNKREITKFVSQGAFPSSEETQKDYFEKILNDRSRITILIKPKKKEFYVGVASLSLIDMVAKECHFSMIIGERTGESDSIFYGMETKALLTEHAFEILGVERINSGQVVELIEWQRWQILFGYQIEGLMRNKFRKGYKVFDVLMSSCLLEDYLEIKKIRGEKFWPGKKKMFDLIKKLPKETLIDQLICWLPDQQKKYFSSTSFD